MDLGTLIDSKTFIGLLSGAIGAIATGALALYRGRVRVLEYRVTSTRVGISAQDATLGDVTLLWQGHQVPNLFLCEIRLKNTTYTHFTDLKFKAYTGDRTFLLNEQTRVDGTTTVLRYTAEYAQRIAFPAGAEPTELQQRIYWHSRDYLVAILNRKQEIVLNYLATVPDGGDPDVYIELQQLGATAKFQPQRPEIHGVPVAWALPLGLVTGVAVVVAVAQMGGLGPWAGPTVSLIVGLAVQSIGAALYRVGRFVVDTVLR